MTGRYNQRGRGVQRNNVSRSRSRSRERYVQSNSSTKPMGRGSRGGRGGPGGRGGGPRGGQVNRAGVHQHNQNWKRQQDQASPARRSRSSSVEIIETQTHSRSRSRSYDNSRHLSKSPIRGGNKRSRFSPPRERSTRFSPPSRGLSSERKRSLSPPRRPRNEEPVWRGPAERAESPPLWQKRLDLESRYNRLIVQRQKDEDLQLKRTQQQLKQEDNMDWYATANEPTVEWPTRGRSRSTSPQVVLEELPPWTRDQNDEFKMFLNDTDGHPDIQSFDGTDVNYNARQFVYAIETVGTKEKWTADDKKCQFAVKLSGKPKEWFSHGERLAEAWARIKKSLPKAFPSDMDFCLNMERIIARNKQPTESYSTYFTYKTMLMKSCNLVGRKAVSCLIGGLPDNIKHEALDQNFATPEELYSYLTDKDKPKTANSEILEQLQNMKNPLPAKPDPPTQKTCYRCKQVGHLAFSCPLKTGKKDDQHPPPVQNSQSSNNLPNRSLNSKHMVRVIVNGYTLQGYNDLSSQCVTIREDHTKQVKLIYKDGTRQIRGFAGNSVNTLGDSNVLLRVGNAIVNMLVFVVPNASQEVPIVIGNTLRKHPEVSYYEDSNSINFESKNFRVPKNSSFAMNERLVRKFQDISSAIPQPLMSLGSLQPVLTETTTVAQIAKPPLLNISPEKELITPAIARNVFSLDNDFYNPYKGTK